MQSQRFIDDRTGEIVTQILLSQISHYAKYNGPLTAGQFHVIERVDVNLYATLAENVTLDRDALGEGSYRIGTVHCTLAEFRAEFGAPHVLGSADDKVKETWHFRTPRGPVEVRDYWWNRDGELSIAATTPKAVLWLAGYLRRVGFKAARGVGGPLVADPIS